MGNETSKQEVVEPPPEWDPSSNAKKFELVSPMSDLSDPSMFLHRRPHPTLSNATVQQIALQKQTQPAREPPARLTMELEASRKGVAAAAAVAARQTPAGDRRRKSKVIATRDSAYKHEPRPRELPPPSSFYFPSGPTRDSEESLNRLSIRRSLSTGATRRQSRESNRNSTHNKDNNKNGNNIPANTQENKENGHRKNNQNTPLFQKAKRNVNKAKTCLTGCFEENNHKMQLLEDNAHGERGQRLSSETCRARMETRDNKMNSEMENALHEKSFDPYKGDTLRPETQSTVLQFIDGKEKELSFNPVWRESHDGTYHDISTSSAFGTDGRRSSTTYTSSDNNTEQRRISDLSHLSKGIRDRQSKESSRRGSDPPSQMKDSCTTNNEKEVNSIQVVEANDTNLVPHPQGDLVEENAEVSKLMNKNEQRAQRRFSTDLTNNVNNEASGRESSSSVATSHESTYWNDYYKEAAQVLHHEDSYFDRIAYKAHQSSSMPEPSPMATKSTATPVAALFRQEKLTKSLLGNMISSPATVDGLHDDLLPNQESIENGLKTAKKDNTAKKASEEKLSAGETLSIKNESHASPVPADCVSGQREMNQYVIDLDITPKSSVVELSSKSSEHKNFACDDDFIRAQPSDEDITAVQTLSRATESDRPMDEPPMYSNSNKDFEDFGFGVFFHNENNQRPSASCSERRISADQVLMQTKLITNMKSDQPKRPFSDIGIKSAVVQETPKALVKQCDSIGSAYSYKDKDSFTPVTSVSTYPKGSPFRPRLNVPEMAMAKAKLEQPAMFTQSFDITSRGSRDMQIHTTESAPSMIQTHDYRDIAFGYFLEDTTTTIVNKKERALALPSPECMSLESPMSTTMSPAHPLLSEQVRNNAAFLFSPSYASANSLLAFPPKANFKGDSQQTDGTVMQKEKGGNTRESSISISTLASRSRLSTRSQQIITIPVSRGRSSLSPDKILSSRSVKSIADGASQKSVRFSDSHSIAESDTGSQKSRRSVRWDFSFKAAPENVNIPAIETKVSDLSDTVFGGMGGRERESMESSSTKRESLDSIKSQKAIIEEEDATASFSASETASRPSLASTRIAQDDTKSSSEEQGTPEQNTRTWTYCEFSKGVTPMLDKKLLAQATNSPVLRFKAAKNKFVNKQEKEVPAKKSTPNLYKRKTGTGRVHLLASKFDTGGEAFLYAPYPRVHNPVSVTAATVTSTTTAASSGAASNLPTNRPFLRTPQIMGYTAKAYPSIYERSSSSYDSDTSSANVHTKFNGILSFPPTQKATTKVTTTAGLIESKPSSEAPFDEPNQAPHDESDDESQGSTESNESTYVQSVATIRQEGRESRSNRSNMVQEDETEEDNSLDAVLESILDSSSTKSHTSNIQMTESQDMPCDEAEDDFAELLLQKLLDDGSERSTNDNAALAPRQSTQQAPRISSIVSYDEDERSEYTNILAVPSYSDESTAVTLTALEVPKLRDGAKTVNPQVQKQHHPGGEIPSSSLFLSPVLKTQVQASKWRELRDQASRQDSKKNIFRSNKKKKGTGLRERDTNVA